MKYYLYVITLKSTGHFYIGVTNDIIRRQHQHYLQLKSAIELRCIKRKPKGKNLYIVFSKELHPLVIKNWAKFDKIVKESYTFIVKFTCDTAECISKKETDLIKRHKNNTLFLNSSLKSTYATIKKSS